MAFIAGLSDPELPQDLQQQKLYGFYSQRLGFCLDDNLQQQKLYGFYSLCFDERFDIVSTIVEIIWLLQPKQNKFRRINIIYNSRNYMAFIAMDRRRKRREHLQQQKLYGFYSRFLFCHLSNNIYNSRNYMAFIASSSLFIIRTHLQQQKLYGFYSRPTQQRCTSGYLQQQKLYGFYSRQSLKRQK